MNCRYCGASVQAVAGVCTECGRLHRRPGPERIGSRGRVVPFTRRRPSGRGRRGKSWRDGRSQPSIWLVLGPILAFSLLFPYLWPLLVRH